MKNGTARRPSDAIASGEQQGWNDFFPQQPRPPTASESSFTKRNLAQLNPERIEIIKAHGVNDHPNPTPESYQ
jgi:hypothetical protein